MLVLTRPREGPVETGPAQSVGHNHSNGPGEQDAARHLLRESAARPRHKCALSSCAGKCRAPRPKPLRPVAPAIRRLVSGVRYARRGLPSHASPEKSLGG